MPWWAWIVFGAALLGAEAVLSTDFYLVFFGIAGFAVGLLVLVGVTLPAWGEWLLFAVLAVFGFVGYRNRLRARLLRPDRELPGQVVGLVAVARGEIAPGAVGSVELRGSVWRAQNVGDRSLADGESCTVAEVDGLTLRLRPGSGSSS